MSQVPPDEKSFEDWQAHPVTQAYKQFLLKWADNLKDQWLAGNFHGDDPQVSFAANAQAIGKASLLIELTEVDYDEFHSVLTSE